MSDSVYPTAEQPRTTTAKIVYILYLAGIIIGLTAVIGVVIAYINRTEAPAWLASHYRFQIRTFWIGMLYLLLGSILATVVVGWLLVLFWLIWLIVRCAQGMRYLDRHEPLPNPTTWWFN
ncbi:DUF4870 family protein [Desulfurivibrio alkaliphilus]|uniref:Transmembrane protein n=1 Tax=Desulfurivibrio alkaliphilus (strain DSM 19089 / UNIQEM U267 / AHT2) TaxID=589865 RepID=D6Z634_DESAT|nr:membrane protein [Desulfurivibrio alkaliphilus]ADH84916.1 conserved hypothetical protein [Desulfurivibrio alkaliphilus AHT 2]